MGLCKYENINQNYTQNDHLKEMSKYLDVYIKHLKSNRHQHMMHENYFYAQDY